MHDYIHVSSDKTITNGGSGVFLTTPNGQCTFHARNMASNFPCELQAILQIFGIYKALSRRSRQMDWSSFVTQEQPSRQFQRETLLSPIKSSSFCGIFKNWTKSAPFKGCHHMNSRQQNYSSTWDNSIQKLILNAISWNTFLSSHNL